MHFACFLLSVIYYSASCILSRHFASCLYGCWMSSTFSVYLISFYMLLYEVLFSCYRCPLHMSYVPDYDMPCFGQVHFVCQVILFYIAWIYYDAMGPCFVILSLHSYCRPYMHNMRFSDNLHCSHNWLGSAYSWHYAFLWVHWTTVWQNLVAQSLLGSIWSLVKLYVHHYRPLYIYLLHPLWILWLCLLDHCLVVI